MLLNDFFIRFSIRGEDVRLMLWDTAGQEEFDAITKAYYRGKLLFSFTNAYCLSVLTMLTCDL